jgi:hypothetical protein
MFQQENKLNLISMSQNDSHENTRPSSSQERFLSVLDNSSLGQNRNLQRGEYSYRDR